LWGKISSRQLLLIVALSRMSIIVVFLPVLTLTDVLQDAWIAALAATGMALLLGALVGSVMMRFPGKSFAEISRESLGPVLGIPAGLSVGILFYFLALLRTRDLTFLLVTSGFADVPDSVLGMVALAVAAYGAYLGPDAMGRAAEFLITLIVVSVLTGFAFLLMSPIRPDLLFLQPVLARGLMPILSASANPVFWFLVSGSLSLGLGKHCADPPRLRRAVVVGLLISGIVLVVMSVTVVVYMGPHQAKDQFSPMLSLAHIAFVAGVIERLDIIIVNLWMLGVVFDVTVLLLVASIMLSDSLGIRPKPTILVLSAFGLVPLSLRLGNVFQLRALLSPAPSAWASISLSGLISLVLIVSLARGKNRKKGGRKNG